MEFNIAYLVGKCPGLFQVKLSAVTKICVKLLRIIYTHGFFYDQKKDPVNMLDQFHISLWCFFRMMSVLFDRFFISPFFQNAIEHIPA